MNSKWKQIAVVLVLLGGVVAIWSSVKTVVGEPQPRAMTQDEVRNVLEDVLAKEKAEQEKLLKEARSARQKRLRRAGSRLPQ